MNMDFPFAYAKINSEMDIVYYNDIFKSDFIINDTTTLKMTDIFEDFDISVKVKAFELENKCYRIFIGSEHNGETDVFVIDNGSQGEADCDNSKIVTALLVLDNYTEVEENIDELRVPHMMAVVKRKINEYFTELGGIIREFEKDKYLFVLRADQLEELKQNKFSIMEAVSKIDMGSVPMSMSIGIGMNGATLAQSMEFARGAADLALARGGGQVVIKDGEDRYQFIGGNGREISKNTGVRARIKAYGLVELINTCTDVIIMGHKNPDLDSLGSCVGMYSICQFFGRKCHIVLNTVNSSISALYKQLMEDSRYESCFIDSENALKQLKRRTLVIVLDTHKKNICECPEIVERAKKLVVIDHHRKGADAIEGYSLTYHESFASSASELVTEMLMYMNKGIKITKTEAEGLLAGITVDTKNFAFKTSAMTFQAAAYLKQLGADTIAVRRLFQSSFDAYVAKAAVVSDAEIIHKNMAISVLRIRVDNPIVLIAQAADELLGIKGIEASYVLNEMDGMVYISARSLGRINVQWIMEKLGGGGHQSGAAAQLADVTANEAINMLKDAIDEYLKEN